MSIRTFLLAGLGIIILAGTASAQEYGPSGAPASWAHPINDSPVVRFFQVDRAEYRLSQNKPSYIWDAQGWVGTDLNKFWVKTEGEGEFGSPLDRGEFQGLYSRMVSSFLIFRPAYARTLVPGRRQPMRLWVCKGWPPMCSKWIQHFF